MRPKGSKNKPKAQPQETGVPMLLMDYAKKNNIKFAEEQVGPLTITLPIVCPPGQEIKIVTKRAVIINKPGYNPFSNPHFKSKMGLKDKP